MSAPAPAVESPRQYRPFVVATPRTFSQRWGPWLAALVGVVSAAGFVAGFSASVTILTLLGFAAAFAGIWMPGLGLFGVAILSTIDPLTRVYLMSGGLLRWNSFNYLLLLVMFIVLPRVLKLHDIHTMLLACFTLLMAVHLTFTPALDVGLYNILNVLAAFGLLIFHLRAGGDRFMLYWMAVVSGLLAGVGGAVYFMQMASLPVINKNAWSAYPLTAIFMVCVAYPYTRRGTSLLTLGGLAMINTVWVFFSGSRGAMLIALVCLGYLLFYTRGVQQKLGVGILALASFVVAIANFGDQQAFALHRIDKLFDDSRSLDSRTSGRSDLVIAGWYLFRDNPLGVGTGGFGPAYAELIDNDIRFLGHEKGAHSAWIKTLAENGIIGLALLLAYVFSFAVHGFRHRREGFLPLGLLVTFVIASAFFSREFQSKGLWFMAASYISLSSYRALSGSPATARNRDSVLERLNASPFRLPQSPEPVPAE